MREESYLKEAIEVLSECATLMGNKGKDYQGGSVCDDDYYPHGWKSFDTMLTTKVLRFRSVMEQQGHVNYDTADDCLRDLINYAARCVVWLNRRAKQEHLENEEDVKEDDYHYSTGEEEVPYNGA